MLAETGDKLNSTINTPMDKNYRPELDTSEELDSDGITQFQQLIGILRWSVELGRIDIYHEVSILSSYNVSPRLGHLEALYRIFAYLKKQPKIRLILDDLRLENDLSLFNDGQDWKEYYPEAEEAIPPNMPEALGNAVDITCFVDASHAGNVVTRRSHTGILIYLNNAPIFWYSKRQNTVETSSFGSELVALRIAVDMIQALRYKLRMMGVPLYGPAYVYCDNKSVVTNTTVPVSTLNKKHNSVCYHRVREAVACGMILIAWIDTHENYADLFTKVLTYDVRKEFIQAIAVGFKGSNVKFIEEVPVPE